MPPTPPPHRSPLTEPRSWNFKRFFIRGLAIVLPTALTITLLLFVYNFVDQRIGSPINAGLREVVLRFTSFPPVEDEHFVEAYDRLAPRRRALIDDDVSRFAEARSLTPAQLPAATLQAERMRLMLEDPDAFLVARRIAFRDRWEQTRLLGWPVLDLIGLVLAVMLVYIIGALLTRSIGRRLFRWGENQIARVPLIGRVYPAFKQVTDFFFGDDDDENRLKFNRVVAVEYPRKGIWSVGLVTGNTMRLIQDRAGAPCLTVFIPSSPTPFTGYVITVPKGDTIDLPVTIEDALKFAVSGGVVVPPSQTIEPAAAAVPPIDPPAQA